MCGFVEHVVVLCLKEIAIKPNVLQTKCNQNQLTTNPFQWMPFPIYSFLDAAGGVFVDAIAFPIDGIVFGTGDER